jgi:hypothetical protein
MDPIVQALEDAGMEKDEIDEVVMVGGSTRIPQIQKLLSDFFNDKKINNTIDPVEVVAYGAAVRAASLSGCGHIQNVKMFDVVPLSLGILFDRSHNTGPLHCKARRTSFGKVICHVELTCAEKPTILTSTQDVVALIGGSAVLEAQARGTPKPIISWSHAGQIIQPSSRFRCLEDVGTFILIITNVTPADAGTFTVTALNKHGVHTVNIDLIVKRKLNKF